MQKKGVSEVVSYAMLILIAVILAIMVFAYLKLYVPKEKPECKEGIDLIIENYGCTVGLSNPAKDQINLTLQNRGRFTVDKVYIRIGKKDRQFKEDVNTTSTKNPHPLFTGIKEGLEPMNSYFTKLVTPNYIKLERADSNKKDYILEIQAAIYTTEDKDMESLALCPPITQDIVCKKIS